MTLSGVALSAYRPVPAGLGSLIPDRCIELEGQWNTVAFSVYSDSDRCDLSGKCLAVGVEFRR